MPSLRSLHPALAAAALLLAPAAQATLIQGPAFIQASTTVPVCEAICGGVGANIAQIADGDTSNFNGFAGRTGVVGTIRLDLLGVFDLSSFSLWNDVNVFHEGVGTFRLDYFDANDAALGSSAVFTAPDGQFAAGVYALGSVSGVGRVDLQVLSLLNNTRIEIREVAFNGQVAGGTVPEPGSGLLTGAALLALGAVPRRRGRV
jgi:hypothetical protein